MKRVIILILFIFLILPALAEDVIYLDKKWDAEASRIMYEYELKEQNKTPQEAYEAFGYKLSDVRAVFYDLNADGIDEVIGYIRSRGSWGQDGWWVQILKKENVVYEHFASFNTEPELGIYILDTKTSGFHDLKVFPTLRYIPTIIKFKHKKGLVHFF